MYQTSIEALIHRLSELTRQRRKLNAEITRVQTLVRTRAALSDDVPEKAVAQCDSTTLDEAIGFTEAVRQILFTYRVWLSPTSVRDLLPSIGFDPNSSRNALVIIHTVLKRLVKNGIAVRRQSDKGVLYRRAESSLYLRAGATATKSNPNHGNAVPTVFPTRVGDRHTEVD